MGGHLQSLEIHLELTSGGIWVGHGSGDAGCALVRLNEAHGWWIQGLWADIDPQEHLWIDIAQASVFLGPATSDAAELLAASELITAILTFVRHGRIVFNDDGRACSVY